MGDNDRIFKPRRGTKTTFSSTKSSTVLSEGELFFEVPDEGQGTGRVRIKMGDGITKYSNLPYAIPFTEDEIIVHDGNTDVTITASSSIQSTAIATNLNNAKSGNTLKTIIHNLREAIYKCACDISYLDSNKQVAGSYAAANHNHSGVYQPVGSYAASDHTHSQYSSTSHTHTTWSSVNVLGAWNGQSSSYNAYITNSSLKLCWLSINTIFDKALNAGANYELSGFYIYPSIGQNTIATVPLGCGSTVKVARLFANGTRLGFYLHGQNIAYGDLLQTCILFPYV